MTFRTFALAAATALAVVATPAFAKLSPQEAKMVAAVDKDHDRWIGVLEYAVRDANPAIFFDPEALAPLQRERVDQFVSEINALA